MFVLRSQQPDTVPMPQSIGQLYATTPETESLALSHSDTHEDSGTCGQLPVAATGGDRKNAEATALQENPPLNLLMLPLFAAAFAVRFGGPAAAQRCPKHFADSQALIDRVSADMERDKDRMSHDMAKMVYALLDDARMLLGAARRNHEEPQGPYDHARAFAKTDAALGHARAAEILHSRCAQHRR